MTLLCHEISEDLYSQLDKNAEDANPKKLAKQTLMPVLAKRKVCPLFSVIRITEP